MGFGGRGQPDEAEGDPLEGAHPEVHTEEGGGLGGGGSLGKGLRGGE